MKFKLISVILVSILLPVWAVWAQEEFSAVVDFNVTLKDAALAAAEGDVAAQSEKYVIFYGTVQSRMVVTPEPEAFVGEIMLVSAEWVGYEDIRMYRCVVRFEGSEYVERIPTRPPRRPSEALIPLDTNVIITGKIIGIRTETDGTRIPVLTGQNIRILHSN
jgi:hypothetical protein